ncbi:hypothetical protein ACGFNP_43660 [Nonomuraea sp. NPDC049269]|uniref:hypothetical protein n=1 Tax=Nonomuraea sp. NPDC049269 TaxID=3364349 RepID=UPI0037195AA5
MKIRDLSAAALLATALGATVLAGAAPASASAARHVLAPLPPDWYYSSHYTTMDDCEVGLLDAAENGQYTGLASCRWYEGDRYRQAGYYFLIYIP